MEEWLTTHDPYIERMDFGVPRPIPVQKVI
jgi:hypothetical protein